jgi:flavin-dependent dehydrogenase
MLQNRWPFLGRQTLQIARRRASWRGGRRSVPTMYSRRAAVHRFRGRVISSTACWRWCRNGTGSGLSSKRATSTLKQSGTLDVDITILGGGPAGAAAALALIGRGYSVAIIERSDYNRPRIGETLPPVVQPLLASLGVWDQFLADKHSRSFGIRSAWGQEDLYDNDFIFSPYRSGWHVDRARFDAMLARCAEEAGGRVYRGSHLLSCAQNDAGDWRIEIAGGECRRYLCSTFLVDATGRASWVARKQGASRITYDRLVGVTFFFSAGFSKSVTDSSTLIEAIEEGWWYSGVLPDSRLVLAYMTDADLYSKGQKQLGTHWQQQLQTTTHTKSRARSYSLTSGPYIMPANSSRLDHIAGEKWLAVGDAAMAFDPLSGQGIYRALQSGIRAARVIDEHLAGDDSSEQYTLEIAQDFEKYMVRRTDYYARETRWSDAIFWRRRQVANANP